MTYQLKKFYFELEIIFIEKDINMVEKKIFGIFCNINYKKFRQIIYKNLVYIKNFFGQLKHIINIFYINYIIMRRIYFGQ